MNRINYTILILLLSFPASFVGNDIEVTGWVVDERDSRIRDAVVVVYEEGRQVDEMEVNWRGKFDASLGINSYYEIEVSAPGMISKRFSFDTSIPETIRRTRGLGFEFVVDLFESYPDLELELFEKPLMHFFYDRSMQSFYFKEEEYEVLSMEVEEARDYINELYDRKDIYDDIIESADGAYDEGNLEEALEYYVQANELELPDDDHTPGRINDIRTKLDIPTEEEVIQYEELIVKADEKFDREKLQEAIEYYEEALSIMPDETYPKERIDKSEDLLAEQKMAEEQPEQPVEETLADEEPVDETPEPEVVEEEFVEEEVVEAEEKAVEVEEEVVETAEEDIAHEEPDATYPGEVVHIDTKRTPDIDIDKWQFSDEQLEQIQHMAEMVKENAGANLIINSYVAKDTNKEHKFYLSKKQASAVIDRMENMGVDKNRLYPVSYGEAQFDHEIFKSGGLLFEIKNNTEFQDFLEESHKVSLKFLNNMGIEPHFDPEVEVLIQFLASNEPADPDYYREITKKLPGLNIYYYYSDRRLHHYSVGKIESISRALDIRRELRNLGYDTYIVVLQDGNRVPTTQVKDLLNR